MGTYNDNSLYPQGILLIHYSVFPEIYGFFLIFITELICMRAGPLFLGISLDPDVCHNSICDIALGCGDKDRIITSARDEQQPLRDSSKTMALIP